MEKKCKKCLESIDRLINKPEVQQQIKKDLEPKGYVVKVVDGRLCIGKSYEAKRNLQKLSS